MSEQGAALQTYNQELVKGIENLKRRRADLVAVISEEECQKDVLEQQMEELRSRLSAVTESLGRKLEAKADYDKAIEATETAYMKILESSQVLLNVVRQEAAALQVAANPKMKSVSTSKGPDSTIS